MEIPERCVGIPDSEVGWPEWPIKGFVDARRVIANSFTTVDWVIWEPFDKEKDEETGAYGIAETGTFYKFNFDGLYVGTWKGFFTGGEPVNYGDGWVFRIRSASGEGDLPAQPADPADPGYVPWDPVVRDQLVINPDGGFESGTKIDGDVHLADLEPASGPGLKPVLIDEDGKLYRAA